MNDVTLEWTKHLFFIVNVRLELIIFLIFQTIIIKYLLA